MLARRARPSISVMQLGAAATHHPPSSGAALAVMVVDDQLAVREGLSRLVACAPLPWRAIASAATVGEAMVLAAQLHPDLVLLDVDLAGEDGLALIPHLAPAAAVLVITCHGDPATRARAQRLGALGFIEKHQPAADLLGVVVALVNQRTGGDKTPGVEGRTTHPLQVASSDAA